MAAAALLRAVFAGMNVWAAPALRVHAPEPGEKASTMDIAMGVTTIAATKLQNRRAPDATCATFKRPEALPRDKVDPLTVDDFVHLPVSGQYDTRFQRFFNKLQSGAGVEMVVLGGSFTAGVDCHGPDGVSNFECAWPARVQKALSQLFPQSSISLLNMAHGGTTTSVVLGAIALLLRDVPGGPGQIDLIMIDTLLNDAYEANKWTSAQMAPDKAVQVSYEVLVRVLHQVAPQALVVSVTDACPKCLTFAKYHRAVASFYGLPLVDSASVENSTSNPALWDASPHPSWKSHQILADIIIGTWAFGFRNLCAGAGVPKPTFPSGTLAPQEVLDQFQTCMAGASEYYASKEDGLQPTIVKGWRLFEDRPGKPGWISEQPGAVMTFRLSFGAEPKLLFTYLKTYTNIGDVYLSMNGYTVTVRGLDTANKVSQSHTHWFNARSGLRWANENMGFGFHVTPRSQDLILNVTAPGAKFKVISVVSC